MACWKSWCRSTQVGAISACTSRDLAFHGIRSRRRQEADWARDHRDPPPYVGGYLVETKLRVMKASNCVMKTSVSHLAVLLSAILLSSLFPSEPALAQGCPTPSFGAPRWFDAGAGPKSVAVGDFNGDRKLDLALANGGSGTVSVLLGNGDGTFRAAVNYRVGDRKSTRLNS